MEPPDKNSPAYRHGFSDGLETHLEIRSFIIPQQFDTAKERLDYIEGWYDARLYRIDTHFFIRIIILSVFIFALSILIITINKGHP